MTFVLLDPKPAGSDCASSRAASVAASTLMETVLFMSPNYWVSCDAFQSLWREGFKGVGSWTVKNNKCSQHFFSTIFKCMRKFSLCTLIKI